MVIHNHILEVIIRIGIGSLLPTYASGKYLGGDRTHGIGIHVACRAPREHSTRIKDLAEVCVDIRKSIDKKRTLEE